MPPSASPTNAILQGLNEAQRRAVSSDASTVAILAGPGSGKTHTLTSRVVWLINHVGYRPEDVVVATFTVKAAREMKERIGRALGDGREKKIVLGTFHSIARRYLAAYGSKIGLAQKFGIADDNDSRSIIGRIIKRLNLQLEPPIARAWISKKKSGGTDGQSAAAKKQAAAKLPGVQLQELQTCFDEYQAQLKRSNLLDYDDLLVRCVELLQNFPTCVSNVQTVLIDEYQDTNGIQYELMKLFAQKRNRITIVGDPDQSIYGWRSAEIRNLWRLLREFPQTDEISLEENYRSSQSILSLSLDVIKQDTNRYQKALKPVHARGSRPVLRRLKSASAEGDWIVSEIKRIILMSGNMLTHGDVAILLRSASLSRHIESALGKAGIKYKMVGGFKFYERAEIKTLLDYLRVIYQPENNDALGRIMNVPKRGIGDGTIKSLIEEAEKSSTSLWVLLRRHCRGVKAAKTKITKHAEQKISAGLIRLVEDLRKRAADAASDATNTPCGLVELIQHLLKALDFQKFLQDSHPEDHEQRWANVEEFLNLAADFVRDQTQAAEDDALPEIEGVEQAPDAEILPRFLANVSLASDAQTGEEDSESKPSVTISTIHAAKGLEWPVVFVPAVYNGSIPHMRAEDSDEERRLLYVAMTRAKSLLYLSCPLYGANSNGERCELSPFVAPLSSGFAKKGPGFERQVLQQIADIVGRKLPSNETIFGALPPMYSTEDDLFPVDPEQQQQETRGHAGDWGASHADKHRSKRPKFTAPTGDHQNGEEPEWKKEYVTTMEERSHFTVAALPGFVNVGAHQAAITAANTAAEAKAKAEKTIKRSTNKRPADQKSILGFVKNGAATGPFPQQATQSLGKSATYAQFSGVGGTRTGPPAPALNPEFAAHKLSTAKTITRPPQLPLSPAHQKKHYACFSSSPPKPILNGEAAEAAEDPEITVDDEPVPEPTRPAACMHSTTFNMPNGVRGGFRRPAGLGRDSITPMAQLRKPFKPLTMNRPSR